MGTPCETCLESTLAFYIERKLLMGGFVEVQASAASSQDGVQSVTVSDLVLHCVNAAVQAFFLVLT